MFSKMWLFIGSVRFVIILLIVVAIASLLGILVPQGLPADEYAHELGSFGGSIVTAAGLDDLFSTWWFFSLLSLLPLSIVSCTTIRLWPKFLRSGRLHFLSSVKDIQSLEFAATLQASVAAEAARDVILHRLGRRFFTCGVRQQDSGFQIAVKNGRLKEVGSLMFHLSLLVLLLGGLIGKLGGSSQDVQLSRGQSAAVLKHDFCVRCDWFKIDRNAEGAVAGYKSKVTIVNNDGSVAVNKIIEVNKPLDYHGVRFYQSSYGEEPERFKQAVLKITGPDFGDTSGRVVPIAFDSAVSLGENGILARIGQFVPDFVIDAQSKKVGSRTTEPNNPAVRVILTRGNDTLSSQWAFARYSHTLMGSGAYHVEFLGYDAEYFTGIKIEEDPGFSLIWIGIICMTVGITFLFYVPRTSIWAFIRSDGPNSCRVLIGGASSRPAATFDEEFKNLCSSFESALEEGK